MIDGRRVLAIVPARAGSQRLPGKNTRPLAGRPLIAWTLDAARAAKTLDRVLVSTDDARVVDVARRLGTEVVDRPAALAGPDASVIDAIAHALEATGESWDYVVLLQPTSPLRRSSDIDGAVTLCHQSGAPSVIGVSPLPKPPRFYGHLDAEGRFRTAEDGDERVVINGAIYVGSPKKVSETGGFLSPGTIGWPMPAERGWDIDTRMEFTLCESIILAERGRNEDAL